MIPVDYFQPESFQQANPLLAGIQAGQGIYSTGQNIYRQGIQNQYLPQTLQQQLQQLQLKNAQLGIQNQYMPGQLQANIGLTQAETGTQRAMPGYYGALANEANARGGLFGAQSNLLQQQTPYLVAGSQGDILKDPIQQRLFELQKAQQMGLISPQLLQQSGLLPATQTGTQAQTSPTPGVPINTPTMSIAPSNSPIFGPNNPAPAISGMPSNIPLGRTNAQNQAQQLSGATIPPAQIPGTPNANMPFTGANSFQNYALFGSPLSPYQMMQLQATGEAMKTQATTGVTQYNAAQDEAAKAADLGTQLSQLTTQFQKAYKDSSLTGGVLGKSPTTGIESLPARAWMGIQGKNLASEQAADNASQNMAALVAKMIAGGRVTNYEMQYINNLKPNRAMDPQTAQMASDFLQQKSIRMKEEQDFLNAARNQNIPIQTANSLWQQYNNQRPVYDFANQKPNTQFQNGWKPFLSPQAVSAVQTGQPYVSIPTFSSKKEGQNWYASLNPGDKAVVRSQLAGGG